MPTAYYIKDGVRRAVAAREAGWTDIPARIIEAGKHDVFTRIPVN
jgi:ParB-like chromosome segregation protein Spo0J